MQDAEPEQDITAEEPASLVVSGLSFSYQGGPPVFQEVFFSAGPGEIIGVTGPVACGKSTLGRVFLQESDYQGSIRIGGREPVSYTHLDVYKRQGRIRVGRLCHI